MTIESALETVQNSRAMIDQWGVTNQTLLAVAGLAIVMFIFSLREVLTWFLRVHSLRNDVKNLREDIAELKTMLAARPAPIEELDFAPAPSELKKKVQDRPAKAFQVNH